MRLVLRIALALSLVSAVLAQDASRSFPALTGQTSTTTTAGPSSTDGASAAATTTGSSARPSVSFPPLSSSFPIPTPTVPPTQLAPYMHTSPLPNNFVFICAGAILGFLFLIVLAWRGLVSWSIYRNIKRANAGRGPYSAFTKLQRMGAEGASVFKKPNAPFYSYGRGSELSLDPLTGGGSKASAGYSTPANRSSLFFSPTANATAATGRPSTAGNRTSTYLPSGYYAAGKSGQGGGVAGNGRPISMIDFTSASASRPQTGTRPQSSSRYSRALSTGGGLSPGPSPMLQPATTPPPGDALYGHGRSSMARLSTASLGARSDGRAPSAFLEDLFDVPPVPQRSVSGDS